MIRLSMPWCALLVGLIAIGCGSCSENNECQEGDFRPCACPDGAVGSQACADGAWDACQCAQPDCIDGETRACTCPGGVSGAQTCAAGEWGTCQCAPPPDCRAGESQDCSCPDGSAGSQDCEDGNWGTCQCVEPECQNGDQKDCTCPDGQDGSQSCRGGTWGDCECQAVWPVDLRGTFASINVASTYSESIIGEVNSTTVIISRLEFDQTGSDLVSTGEICTIELDSGTSFLTTIFPDSFIEALTMEPRPARLEETEDGVKFIGSQGIELRGIHLDDPLNDPLPADPTDPRIWDQDGDGRPGLTVIVEGIIDGEMSIIQRDVSTMTGEVNGPDRVEGLLAFENQMMIVEATNDLLFQGNDYATWQDPVPENSYLIFQRIDPLWTCQDILAERESLFD